MAKNIRKLFVFEASFPWDKFPQSSDDMDPGQMLPKKDRDVSNVGRQISASSAKGQSAVVIVRLQPEDISDSYQAVSTYADDIGPAGRVMKKLTNPAYGHMTGSVPFHFDSDEYDELLGSLERMADDMQRHKNFHAERAIRKLVTKIQSTKN